MHINDLASLICDSINEQDLKSVLFNTITISDGISMGTLGMRYSLVSREVIADSIETVVECQSFDGVVAIGGCDKNMPGCLMGLARLNRPSIFVYGGSIKPGENHTDLVTVMEGIGSYSSNKISEDELIAIEKTALPGPGSCGGMYTANTMASAIEALGMSLPGSSSQDAISNEKKLDCQQAGEAVLNLMKKGITPKQILTKKAFENAIVVKGSEILNEDGLRNRHEFVYHKILDCLGDIMLSGNRIFGHIKTSQGGHALTNKLLVKFFSDKTNWGLENFENAEKQNENSYSYQKILLEISLFLCPNLDICLLYTSPSPRDRG